MKQYDRFNKYQQLLTTFIFTSNIVFRFDVNHNSTGITPQVRCGLFSHKGEASNPPRSILLGGFK